MTAARRSSFCPTACAILWAALWACATAQRLAIVGGGVAGATAAHYARLALGESAEITVFERDRLGGRARELEYDGLTLELGASMAWGKNFLIRDLADAAGLEREAPPAGEGAGLFAVYDGRELVFAESRWGLLTLIRLIWRYWLSWFSFRRAPAATFDKFQGIYALLDAGTPFDRPSDLLKAVGLYELTQQSMFEWLRVTYGRDADLLGSELIAGVNRANYNQGNDELNALAGMVSMLPATEPSVFRIKGGNGQLAPRLLERANASVACPTAVASITRLGDGRFALAGAPLPAAGAAAGGGQGAGDESQKAQQAQQGGLADLGTFDAVVVATPLESSGLSFSGFHVPPIAARKYQQTVATFVKGSVRPSYFGLSEMIYSAVLVSDAAQLPWSSLGLVGRIAGATRDGGNATIWKLFSREPMPHAWLSMMFERGEWGFEVVATRVWDSPGAYPSFDPPEDFSPFRLTDGLYYAAAMENAASAMEVAAIEGRLVAQMAVRHMAEVVEEVQAEPEIGAGQTLEAGCRQRGCEQRLEGAVQGAVLPAGAAGGEEERRQRASAAAAA